MTRKPKNTDSVSDSSKFATRHSTGNELVCDRPENEQDNADLQATTKGDKCGHSITQNTNFIVKVRCKLCDKPFNSITNDGKHLKVSAEAANNCKICGKTFTGAKQFRNNKGSCTTKSYNCMICHKSFSSTDSLTAHVKLHYPCQKISLVQSVLLFA